MRNKLKKVNKIIRILENYKHESDSDSRVVSLIKRYYPTSMLSILTLAFIIGYQACSPSGMRSVTNPFAKGGKSGGATESHGEAYQGKPYIADSKRVCAGGEKHSHEITYNSNTDRFWQIRANCTDISPTIIDTRTLSFGVSGKAILYYQDLVYREFIDLTNTNTQECLAVADELYGNILDLEIEIQQATQEGDENKVQQLRETQNTWNEQFDALDCQQDYLANRPVATAFNIELTEKNKIENFNLRQRLFNEGWNGQSDVSVKIIIGENVTIGSKSTKIPAFNATGLSLRSTIEITNNGTILGMGGRGGNGEFCPPIRTGQACITKSPDDLNGKKGGDAIHSSSPIRLTNNGTIAGGGGGGAGGRHDMIPNASIRREIFSGGNITGPLYVSGGNGGGGSGFGHPGDNVTSDPYIVNNDYLPNDIGRAIRTLARAIPGEALLQGTGGLGASFHLAFDLDLGLTVPQPVSGENGSAGGNPGQAGRNSSIAQGGQPGLAIRGASFIQWMAPNNVIQGISDNMQGEIYGEMAD